MLTASTQDLARNCNLANADIRRRRIGGMRLLVLCTLTSILLSSSSGAQQAAPQDADAASGQQLFNNACRTCHTTKEADNRQGPHLHKIIGRKAGSVPDFGYSSAMKGAGFAWDNEKLERFIADPDGLVPGNKMKPYSGVASAAERTSIVSFLQSVAAAQ